MTVCCVNDRQYYTNRVRKISKTMYKQSSFDLISFSRYILTCKIIKNLTIYPKNTMLYLLLLHIYNQYISGSFSTKLKSFSNKVHILLLYKMTEKISKKPSNINLYILKQKVIFCGAYRHFKTWENGKLCNAHVFCLLYVV